MKKKNKIILGTILAVILVGILGFFIYTKDYYHVSEDVQRFLETDDVVTVERTNQWISFTPTNQDVKTGLILYPGAKVEYIAYAQLMYEIAAQGYQCVLVKMPFQLAIFGSSYADKVVKEYPAINTWYLGGHSLGGAMAASYISSHAEEYAGLVLLAAYSTKDLSDSGLKVLSIYGEQDGVLNRDKLESSNQMMPPDFKEFCIEGGNHAYFADYGEQKGDGIATIERKEQISKTVTQITMFME